MRARQYDPTVGRFEELDPADTVVTDPYASSYLYTSGQPTLLIDPLGLWPNPLDDIEDAAGDLKDAASDVGSAVVDTTTNIATTTASAAGSATEYTLDKAQAGAEWAYNHPLEVWSAASIGIAFLPGGAIAVAGIDLAIAGYQLEHGNTLDAALWALPAGAGTVGKIARECAAVRAAGGTAAVLQKAAKVLRDETGTFAPFGRGASKLTNAQAADMAARLGFRRTGQLLRDQAVFTRKGRYIVQDVDAHSGGLWKMATSINKLNSKTTRLGTYDYNLNWIGP